MRPFFLKITAVVFAVTALTTSLTFADRRWDDIDNWDRDVAFSHYREKTCGYRPYQGQFGRFDRRMQIGGACRGAGDRLGQMTCQYCADAYPNPEQNKSCLQAMRDASRFARMKEGAAGRRDGYLRGFTCGIDSGIDDNINDRYALESGRNSATRFQSEIDSGARSIAEPKGRNDGVAPGEGQALQQYRQAAKIGGGQLPAKAAGSATQYINYAGEADGYARMGYAIHDRTDYIADGELQPYQFFEGGSDAREYQDYFDDRGARPRIREVYRGKGQNYDYQYDRRFPGRFEQSSFDMWRRQAPRRSLDFYFGLNDRNIVVQQPAPKDANGNPVLDAQGQPVPGKTSELSSPRRVFEEAFIEGYRFAGPFMYEKFMRVALDDGYEAGYQPGQEAGKKIAYESAQREEYDRMFTSAAKASYQTAFTAAFVEGYGRSYETLKNSSRLDDAKINAIVGDMNDGIFTPNERAKLSYVVVNIGGKETTVNAEVNSVPAGSVKVTALTHKEVVTPTQVLTAGTLGSKAIDSQQFSVSLKISNGAESLSDTMTYWVQNIFGMGNSAADARNQYLQGQIAVPVTVKNPRTVESKEEALINLYVNEQLAQALNIGKLPAGSQQEFMMMFKVDDPLQMIGQTFVVRVELVVDKNLMQSKTAEKISIDSRFGLVEYFDAIINSRGGLPAGKLRDQREAELIEMIRSSNRAQLESIRADLDRRDKKEIKNGIPDFLNVKKDAASIMAALGQKKPIYGNSISNLALAKLAILLEDDGKCPLDSIDKILSKKGSSGDYYKKQYADIIVDLLDRTGYDNGKFFHISIYSDQGRELQKQLGVDPKRKCR